MLLFLNQKFFVNSLRLALILESTPP